ISILLGNGDGTFGAAQNYRTADLPRSVATGDFNGDSIPDLVVTNTGPDFAVIGRTVSILFGNGDGTFRPGPTLGVGFRPYSVKVADLNGATVADIVVANEASRTVSVLLGNGNGTFAAAQDYTITDSPWSVTVGDFNGDGHPDLATANWGTLSNPG